MVTVVPPPGEDDIATVTMVGGDDGGDDRQAEPGTARCPGPRRVGSVEPVERVRRVVGGHAGPVVGDLDHGVGTVATQR